MIKNNDAKVITDVVRLSYVHIFTPKAFEGQEAKYSCTILLPKSDETTMNAIKKAIEAAKQAGVSKFGGKVPSSCKLSVHDGDGDMPNGGGYGDECKGHYVINATSKTKPGIVDRNCQEIMDSTEMYSGCYARVSINFYAYNTSGNKGIACGLNNVQKIADGDYLGGRSRAEDDFEALVEEADDFLG